MKFPHVRFDVIYLFKITKARECFLEIIRFETNVGCDRGIYALDVQDCPALLNVSDAVAQVTRKGMLENTSKVRSLFAISKEFLKGAAC